MTCMTLRRLAAATTNTMPVMSVSSGQIEEGGHPSQTVTVGDGPERGPTNTATRVGLACQLEWA